MNRMDAAPGVSVLVTRLARLVYRRSPDAVLGMSLKAFVVLEHLREAGSTSQQVLGDTLWLDANALVHLLNELESSGYASRERDPSDRRRHIVTMTSAGRAALSRAEAGIESVEDDVFGALSAPERSELRRLLAKAIAGIPDPVGRGSAL